jgi:TonB family protein
MASGSPLHDFPDIPALTAAPGETAPARVGLVVLTRDESLVHTLEVTSSEYNVFSVSTESDLAKHLLVESSGVAILDAGAIASPIERMTERLRAQFPDLVLIVAGTVDDQSALATQITNGTVYRFLHKPVSEQRVKLFVDAAWRRYGEEHASADSTSADTVPSRHRPRIEINILLLGGAALAVAALLGGRLLLHKPSTPAPEASPTSAAETMPPAAARDDVLENLLARAEMALASGALVRPPGENAAELYRNALQRNPRETRAANGLEKVIDRLLSAAEAQLLAQHLDEAQKLTDEARSIKPDHVRVAFLTAQIGKERERAVLAQARQAASSGNIEQALSVLDGAARDGQHSPLVIQARQELEQKKFDDRIRDYISRANDRMRSGDLVEPAQDNAQFYIESARALAPNNTEVKQTQRLFLDRLVSEARKALATGDADQGEHWIRVATDAGIDEDEIAALNTEAQKARATAKADALAHLVLLFNERLTQGKVVDPPADSAKSYLAQLVQADPNHQSTLTAHRAFAARALDEAKSAVHRQDYPDAQRWLAEAHEAGVDAASIDSVNNDIKSAMDAAKQAVEIAPASALELTHYVPPEFPAAARKTDASGWVDVQLMVLTNGSVRDVVVIGADPVGVFEQSALEAVRKWKYRPILRDGQPINERARVRVRFAVEK